MTSRKGKKGRPYGWDRGLDLEKERRRLLSIIKSKEEDERAKAYACVLYIQLMNGARISEALEAALEWARSGKPEVEVRVRKRSDGYRRLVVIPKDLGEKERRICGVLLAIAEKDGFHVLLARIKVWCRDRLGYNTHALRYAWITWMSKMGYAPQLIAKLSGHKTVDFIAHYTEKAQAEDALRRLLRGGK